MKNFNKGAKTGLMMELISGIVMAILVIMKTPIPDFVAWVFIVGLIITLASTLFMKKNK